MVNTVATPEKSHCLFPGESSLLSHALDSRIFYHIRHDTPPGLTFLTACSEEGIGSSGTDLTKQVTGVLLGLITNSLITYKTSTVCFEH